MGHTVNTFLEKVNHFHLETERSHSRLAQTLNNDDLSTKDSHTYRIPVSKQPGKRIIDMKAILQKKVKPKVPDIVQRQKEMLREKSTASPFLVEAESRSEVEKKPAEEIYNPKGVFQNQHYNIQTSPSFLSLDLFDPCPEPDPEALLLVYCSLDDPKVCYARSKWVFQDGRPSTMKKC